MGDSLKKIELASIFRIKNYPKKTEDKNPSSKREFNSLFEKIRNLNSTDVLKFALTVVYFCASS